MRRFHEQMLRLRVFDERALSFSRSGRVGVFPITRGHEAIQAGSVGALRDEDWVVPSYREWSIGLLRGIPPQVLLAYFQGHPSGWYNPGRYRVANISIPVGSQVPHAAGLAWGERLQRRAAVALVFFGDGATSEGSCHEGINFAAVLGLPVVLVCNNNQWAISTPLRRQTRAAHLSDKAIGYGIPASRVDGNDPWAVHEAVADAARRARAGDGPTFIECVTYRPGPHASPDDPTRYRTAVDAEASAAEDPLARVERWLGHRGLLDADTLSAARARLGDEFDLAMDDLEALPAPGPEVLFEHVYHDPPPAFAEDLAALEIVLGRER